MVRDVIIATDGADARRYGRMIHSWAYVVYERVHDGEPGVIIESRSGAEVGEEPIHSGEVLAFVKAVEYAVPRLVEGWSAEFRSDNRMLVGILDRTLTIRRNRAHYIMDMLAIPILMMERYDGKVTYRHVKRSGVREADHLARAEWKAKAVALMQGEDFVT